MKAVDSHLLTLLKKSSQFIVPIYQRVYSWQEAECEQLWSDILRAGVTDRMGAHFTGSIVYVARGQSTNTSAQPDLIIDGQQRGTTVTLVLAALAQHLDTLPEDQREPWDGFSPKKIRNRYLLNDDEEDERQFKLVLSQGDRDALKAIVLGAEPDDDTPTRVITNYRFFRDKFADPTLDLAALCRGLDKLVVVDVTLTRGVDNPQLVFEAMNSTGKKLSQADLIRNYVLMDMPPKEQDALYTAYWRPMELEFVGSNDSQFDEFVRHYLTIKTGEIPRLGDIYDAFKAYSFQFVSSGQSMDDLVIELRQYAKRYGAIALGKEGDKLLRRAFKDLDQIKADVVYPFLLEVYSDYEAGTITHQEMLNVIEMVTSYVFRRAVCRVPTNSLNKTFAGFSSAVRKDPNLLAASRRELFEKLSTEVLALDPGVTRHFLKLYIAVKAETNFLDIVPQKARMRLSLNIPIEALHDERGLAWDVSGKGHWGNGPTEVGLAEDDDFTYVMGLVRQAFEYQMGGD